MELHQFHALLFVNDPGAVGSVRNDQQLVIQSELPEIGGILEVVLVVESLGPDP